MAKRRQSKKKKTSPRVNLSELLRADRIGIALLALALLTLFSLISLSRGALTEDWLHFLRLAFGWGAYLTPLVFGTAGLWLLLTGSRREPEVAWEKIVGAALLFTVGLALTHSLSSPEDPKALATQGGGGGYLGWLVSWALVSSLGRLGAYIAIAALASVAIIMLSGLSPAEIGQAFRQGWNRLRYLWESRLSRLRHWRQAKPSVASSPGRATEPSRPVRGPIFPRIASLT